MKLLEGKPADNWTCQRAEYRLGITKRVMLRGYSGFLRVKTSGSGAACTSIGGFIGGYAHTMRRDQDEEVNAVAAYCEESSGRIVTSSHMRSLLRSGTT